MQATTSPFATEKISKLIFRFAIPAIISGLVSAIYNIVDQIFIGHKIGFLGNAATNVTFPIVTICTALALLLGVGTAARFNLALGRNDVEKATETVGTGISLVTIVSIAFCLICLIFLEPMLRLFGANSETFPYALSYASVTTYGIPFLVISTTGSNIIRADGSPKYAMYAILSGAILNTILDPFFMFYLDMGIEGAAYATVIGQVVSCTLVVSYFSKFKSVNLTKKHFIPKLAYAKEIAMLGMAPCFNQLAMALIQITLNNSLEFYGKSSIYGSEVPLACVAIITKVNIIFIAAIVGISQGCQPIISFNYGAKNYARVKETYGIALRIVLIIGTVAFVCFQFFPRQIISIFGGGTEEYFLFAERTFRIYMFFAFINGIQPITGNFFTAIGKAKIGIAMSLTRQVLFLFPLILILPRFFGIDGILFAAPISDVAAFLLATTFLLREMRTLTKLSAQTA